MSIPSTLPTVDVNVHPVFAGVSLGGTPGQPIAATLSPLTLSLDSPATGGLRIAELPAIEIKPLDVNLDVDVKPLHISIDNLPTIRLGLEPVRCHVPVNFGIGFSLFGKNIACIRFFGESQFIAEPYKPNPCECCGTKEK